MLVSSCLSGLPYSTVVGLGASIVGMDLLENTTSTERRMVQSVLAAGTENQMQTAAAD